MTAAVHLFHCGGRSVPGRRAVAPAAAATRSVHRRGDRHACTRRLRGQRGRRSNPAQDRATSRCKRATSRCKRLWPIVQSPSLWRDVRPSRPLAAAVRRSLFPPLPSPCPHLSSPRNRAPHTGGGGGGATPPPPTGGAYVTHGSSSAAVTATPNGGSASVAATARPRWVPPYRRRAAVAVTDAVAPPSVPVVPLERGGGGWPATLSTPSQRTRRRGGTVGLGRRLRGMPVWGKEEGEEKGGGRGREGGGGGCGGWVGRGG